MSRLLALNKPEWPYGVVGFIAACVAGCAQPAVSFLLSAFITVFYLKDMDELKRQVGGGGKKQVLRDVATPLMQHLIAATALHP
jgi:hypothetical protein